MGWGRIQSSPLEDGKCSSGGAAVYLFFDDAALGYDAPPEYG
jgi:hypothetical protein